LARQRSIGRSGRSAIQCSPEASCSVEADFERIVERQDDRVDFRCFVLVVDDEPVRAGRRTPSSVFVAAIGLVMNAVETRELYDL